MGIPFIQKIIDIIRLKKIRKLWLSNTQLPPTIYETEYGIIPINTKYCSFGEDNPDKIFYLIYRPNPAGMFSNISYIMHHLALIDGTNLIPVVDFQNYVSTYNINKKINGTSNSFEDYFKRVSNYSVDEVLRSKHVLICDGTYHSEPEIVKKEKEIYNRYFHINDDLLKELNDKLKLFNNKKTLGVHLRGTDMITCPYHPTPMTFRQAIKYVDKILEKENINQIFLATDEKAYKEDFCKYYENKGIKVIITDEVFDWYTFKNQVSNANDDFNYRMGKYILTDVFLFSHCSCLFGILTNILYTAGMITKNSDQKRYIIDNGNNFPSQDLNKYRWELAKYLPIKILGFKDKLRIET